MHDVKFSIPERELGKADIEFSIKKDRQMLGRLKVSKGSIVWVLKDATFGYEIKWDDFDKLMRENGKHEKT